MITDEVKALFIKKYEAVGSDKFYKFLIAYSLEKASSPDPKGLSPEIELMNYYEIFLQLYRRENNEIYLEVSRQFRKAGNKIYRILLKKDLTQTNTKFLNLI